MNRLYIDLKIWYTWSVKAGEQNMDSTKVRAALTESIWDFVKKYKRDNNLKTSWKKPLVGFADAKGEYIISLKDIVSQTHYLPCDFMPECTVVISYFLPFAPEIGRSNIAGDEPSRVWVTAYDETNEMFLHINENLAEAVENLGYSAVSPNPVGMIDGEHIYSNWSQRHIAYAAGLGTFGINNMLITEKGTCGRFYSIITDLPVKPDIPLSEERCLYKRTGSCGMCVRKCPVNALDTERPFDRNRCALRLDGFCRLFGADVCGKCVVDLPCTCEIPLLNA